MLTFLQLRGMPLQGGPTEQESVDVTPAPYTFKRVRALRGNPYLQTQTQGAGAGEPDGGALRPRASALDAERRAGYPAIGT